MVSGDGKRENGELVVLYYSPFVVNHGTKSDFSVN